MTEVIRAHPWAVSTANDEVRVNFDDGTDVVIVPYNPSAILLYRVRYIKFYVNGDPVAQFNSQIDERRFDELVMQHYSYSAARLAEYWVQAIEYTHALAKAYPVNKQAQYAYMVAGASKRALEALQKTA